MHEARSTSSRRVRTRSRRGLACPGVTLIVGLLLVAAPALASGSSLPEEPVTGLEMGCELAISAEPGVEVCGILNPHSKAKVGYYFAYNKGSSCLGGWRATGREEEVEGEAVKVYARLLGLEPHTNYTYCLVATNEHGETFGQALSFATPPEPCVLSIEPNQWPGGAHPGGITGVPTLYGTIYLTCGGQVEYHFEYGATENGPAGHFESSTAIQQVEVPKGGYAEVSGELFGLLPHTEYRYGVVASHGGERVDSAEGFFWTEGRPPSISGQSAGSITPEGVVLEAQINPFKEKTSYSFHYSTEESLDGAVTVGEDQLTASLGAQPVSTTITSGLMPNMTYYYQVVAENASGSTSSEIKSFATLAMVPQVKTGPAQEIGQTEATLTAGVNPEGASTTYSIEYGPDSHYGASSRATNVGAGRVTLEEQVDAQALVPESTYHFRVVAHNIAGTAYGSDQVFTTTSSSHARPLGNEPAPGVGGPSAATSPGLFSGPGAPQSSTSHAVAKTKAVTRSQELKRALNVCSTKARRKRAACVRAARKRYGPVKKHQSRK